jgi:hypothetical protein
MQRLKKLPKQRILQHDNTVIYADPIESNNNPSIRLRSKRIGAYDDVMNEIESITR